MSEMEFGKLLEKLIYISGQKNYSIARQLKYDVSYISKWINTTMLPSAKNIDEISRSIADYIVSISDEAQLNKYCKCFNEVEGKSKSEVAELIENGLNEAYKYSYNKINKKKINNSSGKVFNSQSFVNPSLRKRYLNIEIKENTRPEEILDVIVASDFFAINRDDQVYITGINNREDKKYRQNLNIKYIFNFQPNIDDIISNILMLLDMITSKNRDVFELYSSEHICSNLITVIKNKYLHAAMYTNKKCIMTTTISEDREAINQMYHTLDEMLSTQCTKTFIRKSPRKTLLDADYIKYTMGNEIKIISGEMNELFMPADLFLEIGEKIFKDDEIIENFKRVNSILHNAYCNNKIQAVIYESAIRKFVTTGEITYFNMPIKLSVEQRRKHLKNIYDLLTDNENIEIKIIEDDLESEFKIEDKPVLFISRTMSFTKEKNNEIGNDYLIVRDKNLELLFKEFFSAVWNKITQQSLQKSEGYKRLIEDLISYLDILSDEI